VSKQINK